VVNVAAAGSGGPTAPLYDAFGVTEGDVVEEVRSGRVNATFVIGAPPRLVVQRLNPHYFADPLAVMENLVRVIGHLEWKQAVAGQRDAGRWFPALVPTTAGRSYAIDDEGCVWRGFAYLPGATIGVHADDATISSAARVYGRLLAALDDFGGPELEATVPRFRDLDRIIEDFDEAFSHADQATQHGVADELDRARRLSDQVRGLTEPVIAPTLRRRLLHNDTKLSNVLVEPVSEHASAVIDFDLVGEGWAMDDFGDFVRSASHHRRDNGSDTDFFSMLATEYVAGAQGVLSPDEIASFAVGPSRVCVQLAWRYLTDHVASAPTLRVEHPDGARGKATLNLDLAERLLGNAAALNSVVSRLAAQER